MVLFLNGHGANLVVKFKYDGGEEMLSADIFGTRNSVPVVAQELNE